MSGAGVGDTWHRLQTIPFATIRPLISILAQRVSYIRAETAAKTVNWRRAALMAVVKPGAALSCLGAAAGHRAEQPPGNIESLGSLDRMVD
jgi:hypothetical protein